MPEAWRHVCVRNSIGRVFAVVMMVLTIFCSGCDSKPAKPEYSGPVTNTPMTKNQRKRIVETLTHYVAQNYKSISLIVSYDDLNALPKLRRFLVGLGFVYHAGQRWRFTRKAYARANGFSSDWISFRVAHGAYDHLDFIKYGGPNGLGGGDLIDIEYHIQVSPSTPLGLLFAASGLIVCGDDHPSRTVTWGKSGSKTSDGIFLDYDKFTLPEFHDVHQLDCPETRDQ